MRMKKVVAIAVSMVIVLAVCIVSTTFADSCGLPSVTYNWDFAAGDQGFTTATCDTGGDPVWQYGTETTIGGAPGNVWGTVLNGSYPNNAGEALVSPPFTVDATAYLVEIHHYYDIENNFDGGNLMVNGQVVPPVVGYPEPDISDSDFYYAWCVDMQPGFSGSAAVWMTSCFDLSAFMGQQVQLEFQFGSDSSVTYPGWYIASVKVGGEAPPVGGVIVPLSRLELLAPWLGLAALMAVAIAAVAFKKR